MIEVENRESVRVIKLNRRVTHALNLELVEALSEALKKAETDPGIRTLVISSAQEKFFSIGFDLPRLYGLGKKEFLHFYRKFNRLCRQLVDLPKPVVAAITGHAIAGGCILALCCDVRVMAEGRKLMGLNEIKLGVPVPDMAVRLLKSLVDDRVAHEIIGGGEFYTSSELLQMGMVDQVVTLHEVLPVAVEKASMLASISGDEFALKKKNRVEPLIREAERNQKKDEENFLYHWFSAESRKLLKETMKKF
jgi:enoyl-CoA hydratase/carnithine racemase